MDIKTFKNLKKKTNLNVISLVNFNVNLSFYAIRKYLGRQISLNLILFLLLKYSFKALWLVHHFQAWTYPPVSVSHFSQKFCFF